ncbi:PDR/VanB family oxidoreductase [Acerihabitans sp. TG2]|uniref:PDR/VanB family oxidoreductase n=1 Tax=Acerihabitans sp. TG2 TaxID=3096008 RepID=UPI002B223811|nr:PDR/VanB family oxidoreductase [Acerihabitans sp. TG2]MEA9391575.1 PDR/VanB family oxidoreductase [Acerihabitans sp. TG2]
MKHTDLIPVSIKTMTENGLGNVSIQMVAQQGGVLPAYSPGAHIDIFIPDIGTRQYSLCTECNHTDHYEICVKLADLSAGGSDFIHHRLKPGDSLSISAPRHHFPLPAAGRYLLFAGGIGITPLLAMAENFANQGIDFELHYYVSDVKEIAFKHRLHASHLAKQVYLHGSDTHDSLRDTTPVCLCHPDQDTAVIACGPDGFVQRLKEIMQRYQWKPSQLSFERFTHAELDKKTENQDFYIELNSTGQRFLVKPDQTIAEVLLSAKIDIMLSCEQGMCGACITEVIDGIPEHRDCVLSEDEKAQNTQMTLCCSRSKSPVLVLDL